MMEIKRKTEIFIQTTHHFVVRRTDNTDKLFFCCECGKKLFSAENAEVFDFNEPEKGATTDCPTSLETILDSGNPV